MDSFLGIMCVFYIAVVYIEGMLICPIGWDEFGDACYFLNHAARVDYEEAEDACHSFGAYLTTIYSMEEQGFLASRIQNDEDPRYHFYFIGLNDKEVENTFVWSDGTLLDGFKYWGQDQPNNDDDRQDCVGLAPRNYGMWNDIRCNNITYAYICKRGKDICVDPLGMDDETIQDNQITASSMYSDSHDTDEARLNYIGAWRAGDINQNQWIQVDFGTLRSVSGIVTQGDYHYDQWVTKYKVEYSSDGDILHYVQDDNQGNDMIFHGNSDKDAYVTSLFPSTIIASRIRIHPTEWYAYISMRFEIIGCEVSDMCVKPLGMKDGTIQDNQITASSRYRDASEARLDSKGSWRALDESISQWIQLDFGTLRSVSGITTQGYYYLDQWVTRYKVEYSNNGVTMHFVRDDSQSNEITFRGNSDRDAYVTSLFPSTIIASRIRIHPTEWYKGISMRFELIGCEVSDMCVDPLGMQDGTIEDNQITASSEYDEYSKARYARLNGTGAWIAKFNNDSQWIQVDFGTIQSVSGIVTQGNELWGGWVTQYSVEYYHDNHDDGNWKYVKDVAQPDKMIFRGNSDTGTYVTSLFPSPVIATGIRIRPTGWNTEISMRFELLGCEVIDMTTLGTTTDLVSTDLRASQSSLVVTTETIISPTTDTETADSKLPSNQKSNITGTAIGVTVGFVFLLVVIGCIIYFCKRRKQQNSSQPHTVLQLDGPYGDTVTNAVTSQPNDANTSESVDRANTGASQILAKEDHGELYQDVPDRPGDIPVDHEDTYQDVRGKPTNSAGANNDIYHDIRDAEYHYARVDKKRLIQVPNDDSDHTTSHGNDASRSGEANQQEGWVDNDIYGRSDEEQPKRQRVAEYDYARVDKKRLNQVPNDDTDHTTSHGNDASRSGEANQQEGWVDNDIYGRSDEERPKRQDDEDSNTEGWEDNSIYAT